jgi:predicted  nucleic acid-binding Zn-ribbon protein
VEGGQYLQLNDLDPSHWRLRHNEQLKNWATLHNLQKQLENKAGRIRKLEEQLENKGERIQKLEEQLENEARRIHSRRQEEEEGGLLCQ